MAGPGEPHEAPLENRLRNLILSHAGEQPNQHTQNRSHDTGIVAQPGQDNPSGPASPAESGHGQSRAPKTSRKRPNQAQRRQMSAQLSIPVDTRPQPSQSHRPYAGSGGHRGQHHHRGGHHRPQQSRSTTFRPPSLDNAPPSAPPTGMSFPSRSRHQSSLSYHGPMPAPDQFAWPQPAMRQGDAGLSYQMPGMPGMPLMPPLPFDAPPSMHSRQDSSDLSSPRRPFDSRLDEFPAQVELLEGLCNTIVADAEIDTAEIAEKEHFRVRIEQIARSAISEYERSQNGFHDFPPESVQLKCFGSLASGFATKASDMDLGILSPLSRVQPDAPGSPIPRLVEKAFLDAGLGARLLTQTRVPIIKVCERPPEELRMALLAERAKWDKGVAESGDEDETHDAPEPHAVEEVHVEPEIQAQKSQEETRTVEQRLQGFKQSETASLPAYFGPVKRLLRRVGGRDITHSNAAEFRPEDVDILNKVILTLVDGLADTKLRDRLLAYRSLNRTDLLSPVNGRRTLLGAFAQVEGEYMAMLWESRPFQEKDRAREMAAENTVWNWRRLQDKPDFGRDPLAFQKELQMGAEQLKKIPSIQVLLLSQAQNESATSYCSRTQRLMSELGGHDSRSRLDTILPTLVKHYIEGILDPTIREQVRDFQQTYNVTNLRAIGRRHKSLQLAHEYETCLAKGLYADDEAAKVRRYLELLRAPAAPPSPAGHVNGVIPLPADSAPLLSEIRALGDPSRAAPNQPRDRYGGILEFPKSGVGVQCDINFSAHLAVQNTLLLRCYSHCDPRVRPLVLFVKHWAKVRRINSPYRGTLGSYGYAIMMLHYLVNIARPFVCPNLQHLARPPDPHLTPQQAAETVQVKGWNIQFWRDEGEIARLARDDALTQNRQSVGELLHGFFEYYAKGGAPMARLPCRSFDWGRDVVSLRTHGGLLSKQDKGWTGAKTVVDEVHSAAAAPTPAPPHHRPDLPAPAAGGQPADAPAQPAQSAQQGGPAGPKREVRYRYLFAIEDPFELDHNVARTVTHTGIVNIRDEFRRAWRIIKNAGRGGGGGGGQQNQTQAQTQAQAQAQAQAQGPGQSQGQGQGYGQGHGWKQEDLLEDVGRAEQERERDEFDRLLEDLHGVALDHERDAV